LQTLCNIIYLTRGLKNHGLSQKGKNHGSKHCLHDSHGYLGSFDFSHASTLKGPKLQMTIYDFMRYTARATALFFAFLAGNMLAHQNDTFPAVLIMAIMLALW